MSNVIHAAIERMSDAAMKEFPAADFVITVTTPREADGSLGAGTPVVRVHAGAVLKNLVETNLVGIQEIPAGGTGRTLQLLPKKDELLKIVHTDATASYCVNIPGKWRWYTLQVTER